MGDPEGPPEPEPPVGSPPRSPPLSLPLRRGRVLVWGAAAARVLRERHRLSGVLVGAPPRRGGRGRPRLPLQLLPEEARLLAERGLARLLPGPETPPALEAEGRGQAPPPPAGSPTAPPSPLPPAELARPSPHWPHGGRPPHERRFRVFRDLWGRGLHLTPGGKFGGDFLVYPGPPERFHAAFVALCPPPGAGLPLGALVAAARLGTHVRKTLLLCTAPPGGDPAYTSVTWRSDL